MTSRIVVSTIGFAASILVAGCASTNGLVPHASPRDDALATQRSLGNVNVSIAAWPKTDWWKAFNDRQLDALMEEALAGSPTLKIAAARTRKALAAADLSGAALLPRVDGIASSTRQRYPENGLTPPQYNQVLADATREVVDQLASYRSLEEQRTQQRAALATAREAYDLALLRYREGLGNYLQVLSAEQPLHVQQSLDADLHARGLELAINLARALGGGYEAPPALANVSLK